MSTGLATRPATQHEGKLSTWVQNPEARERIESALGTVLPVDTFIAHMMVAFQAPEVKNCTPLSQFTALHECAAMGLLPTLNQVKLIPYKDIIKAMPQWQGFKAIMERHPSILEVEARLVHVTDTFAFKNGEVFHEFDPFNDARKIASGKDIRGGYLRIVYRDGRPPKYHMVPVAQITKCQNCAQTQKVWQSWYEQMALKTVYRDAFARRAVPLDPFVSERLQKIVDADDLNLGNVPTPGIEREAASKTERLLQAAVTEPPVEPPYNPPTAEEVEQVQHEDRQPGDEPQEKTRAEALAECTTAAEIDAFQKAVGDEVEVGRCSQDEQMALLNQGLKMKADFGKKRR